MAREEEGEAGMKEGVKRTEIKATRGIRIRENGKYVKIKN